MMSTTTLIPALLAVDIRTAEGEWPINEVIGWELEITEEPWAGPGTQLRVRAWWRGTQPTQAGLVVRRQVRTSGMPRVLVPAVFYGDNGSGSPTTHYPRLGALDPTAATAPGWDFASERTALPAVFLQQTDTLAWLAVAPGGSGVGFSLGPDLAEARVHFPGLERPFRHDRTDAAPCSPLRPVAPDGALELTAWYGEAQAPDPQAVARVQRALQRAWGGAEPRPVDRKQAQAAAQAATEGLLHTHYRMVGGEGILAETVAFDGSQVREEMHVAWVSGAPTAYALLRHGLRYGDATTAQAARTVLDTIARGLAPCGAFWGVWTPRGWRAGWNNGAHRLHARTLAEATLFLARALVLEPGHPRWAAAVRSNLDFCLRCLDDEGNAGAYYHALTGEVLDRRGTAGLLWAAALAEGAGVLNEPAYLAAALRVGAGYASAIRAGALLGAPEDIGLCPSSEDGYCALLAMMALERATGDPVWRDLAQIAADWLLTFRWSYNVQFPADSPLDRRGFRTRGADGASPSNHHLHCYGLIAQADLLRLSALLNDPWYAARAADHLACFLGEVVLADGQWGGAERRGLMSEQWYTADWAAEGRAGSLSPISHAWCLGLLLLAADEWIEKAPALAPSLAPVPVRSAPRKSAPRSQPRSQPARVADQPHPVRLLPGFYQVGGGYLSHMRDAASYLLVDEQSGESILVDCGSHSGLPTLRANVAQVADLSRLQMVIGTHCHWDHVEAFGHLREEITARFAIHILEAQAVQTGAPDWTCARWLYNEPFHPFPVDLLLHGGEQFHLGMFDLEILHLPGHSPGCIGVKVYYAPTGQTILIPGDAVQGGFGRQIHSSVTAWKRSLRRLMMEQIDFMVPNHLPAGAQTSLLADVPNRLARIYSQLQTDFHSFMDHQRT